MVKYILGIFSLITLSIRLYADASPWQMNMYKGVSPISHEMYDLHMIAIYICAVIGVLVFGVMIYSIIHHRKSKGYVAANFHDNLRLEIVWSIIPFLILVGLAFPATRVLIDMHNTNDSDVTIKVTGSQWKWQYQYLNEGIQFYSILATPFAQIENHKPKGQWYLLEVDKPLVLPVLKKIRFLVTSQDVVHSWWVPELGIKRDAIPGYMYEAWTWIEKPGTYRGQCAELCGINHGFMPIVVEAVSQEDFDKWVTAQAKVEDKYVITQKEPAAQVILTRNELMELGKKKYRELCASCHQIHGEGIPPLYPALKGSSVSIGKPISRHISIILHGVSGSAMDGYHAQLTDKEIAAIVTYERNAWDNNTNDIVQASEVAKVRELNLIPPKIVNKVNAGRLK
ncbi:MAG: cytochrome c oxidase subunit II [Legionellales bacterium RIFCSPHIGHO2_12_FULL_37_14]|nr:MAG: cytochrome c oxidase subunit II [Legionellales bacterium RIFCSPHIGHO2_12_FULL_37_14]